MANWAKMGFAMNPWAGGNGGAMPATRKRRKSKAKAAAPKRRKRASTKRPARLVKGSKAAKAYMASIRKRRKKR
jgi:hypothetical protein